MVKIRNLKFLTSKYMLKLKQSITL